MTATHFDLVVRDVRKVAEFLETGLGLRAVDVDDGLAVIDGGGVRFALTSTPPVEMGRVDGLAIHLEVEDVVQAVARAADAGAQVERPVAERFPGLTDAVVRWGELVFVLYATASYGAPPPD